MKKFFIFFLLVCVLLIAASFALSNSLDLLYDNVGNLSDIGKPNSVIISPQNILF